MADGLHSCSEHIRGRDPLDIHETCDITDHTWALGYLLQATGEANYADRIEQVIFNALPGAVTKDFQALQYFSCPNQVLPPSNSNHKLFMHGLNWMSYRPDHEVQCCPGNLHRAMPNYVAACGAAPRMLGSRPCCTVRVSARPRWPAGPVTRHHPTRVILSRPLNSSPSAWCAACCSRLGAHPGLVPGRPVDQRQRSSSPAAGTFIRSNVSGRMATG